MTDIRKIHAQDTYRLRHPILRQGYPIESCHFDGDDADTTLHFGLYINNDLAGIISLFKANHPTTNHEAYQIRGMATTPEVRGLGCGKALVNYAEAILKDMNVKHVWANARINALGFYENLGYQACSEVFLIEGVGDHIVIEKRVE